MKKLSIFLITLVGLAASSAMSQDVRFNFDVTADFTKFKTYKWVTIKGLVQAAGLTKEQIEAAFDSELAEKGLAKVDNDSADLFVAYQFGIDIDQKFRSFATDATDVEYLAGLPLGGTMPEAESIIYKGELALDMYATCRPTRVWRGVVSKTIDLNAKPNARQKHLTKAAKKLFEYYPPVAKGGH